MNTLSQQQMSDLMEETFKRLREIRKAGQAEYAHDPNNAFGNFDRIAERIQISREKVWLTYFLKHVDGIIAHINGHVSQRENVAGRIDDCQVYLELFRGMCQVQGRENRLSILRAGNKDILPQPAGPSIYVAGPMRGIKNFNFPAFHAATKALREKGWLVWSPAENDIAMHGEDYFKSETGSMDDIPDFDFPKAFKWDLVKILESDAIFMLQGWGDSEGATHEHATAMIVSKKSHYYSGGIPDARVPMPLQRETQQQNNLSALQDSSAMPVRSECEFTTADSKELGEALLESESDLAVPYEGDHPYRESTAGDS
jgi:hypothetical protein